MSKVPSRSLVLFFWGSDDLNYPFASMSLCHDPVKLVGFSRTHLLHWDGFAKEDMYVMLRMRRSIVVLMQEAN